MGWAGPVVFALFYLGATLFFVPTAFLAFAGGALFGVLLGLPVVSAASLFACLCVFCTGRWTGRGWLAKKFGTKKRFQALDHAVASDGWKIVLLLRLAAVFPFNPLNYALGMSRIRLWDYLWASCVGMLPGILLYVYLGALAGSLTKAGAQPRSAGEWTLFGAGLLATFAVSTYIIRLAKKAVHEQSLQ